MPKAWAPTSARALRAAALLLLLSACMGGDAPAGLDGGGTRLKLPIAAAELPRTADAPALPINRIRAVARSVPEGAVLATVVTDVNPAAAEWQIELEIDLAALPTITVVVTFELINVDAAGNETVQFSGRTDPIVLTAGEEATPAPGVLVRGPLSNLDVTAIQIVEPLGNVLEGATKALAATVTTTGPAPSVFWSSLDPTATVTGSTATGVLPGTARIVASVGALADTAVLTVVPRPTAVAVTPDSVNVNDVGPEVTLSGVVLDRRGAVIPGQAVLWRTLTPTILQDLGGGRFRTIGTGLGQAEGRAAADTTLKDVTVVRVRRPATDVAVTKTGPAGQAAPGEVVEFTVRAANGSAVTALGVSVSETLPEGLTLESATASHGAFADGVWTIGDLAPGSSATLTVRARVGAGREGQTLTNVARLRPLNGQDDGNASNNEGRASVTVRFPPTDLAITKTVAVRRVEPGDTADFTITVTNNGPTAVTELIVNESPPEQLVLLSGSPSRGSFDEATHRWTVGSLEAGASATLRVKARATARGAGMTVVNRTRIVSFTGATDANAANNAASVDVVIENRSQPQNRTLHTFGNTALVAGSQEIDGPHVFSAAHALTGTTGLTVTSTGARETPQGGTLTMEADGKFVYQPPLGAGAITDTVRFYTVAPDSTHGSALLTLIVDDPVIWYVNNTNYVASAQAPAAVSFEPDGSSLNPFPYLNYVEDASAAGDWIFVHYGDGTSNRMDDGVTLKDDQHLIGEGVGLTVDGVELVPPGDKPTIFYDDGYVVDMANGNTVTGLAVEVEYGSAIHADNRTDGTIADVRITSTEDLGLDFYNVHGTWAITDLDMESSGSDGAVSIHEGDADFTIDIAEFEQDGGGPSFTIESTTGGSVIVQGGTINDYGQGIFIDNNAADIEFHAPVVIEYPGNHALQIQDNSGHVYFPDLTVVTDEYTGIQIDDNTGEVEIDGSVDVTDEAGLDVECDLEGPCGPIELTFSKFQVHDHNGYSGPPLHVERVTGSIDIALLEIELTPGEGTQTAVELVETAGLTLSVADGWISNSYGSALSVSSYAPIIGEVRARSLVVRGPHETNPRLSLGAASRPRVLSEGTVLDVALDSIHAFGSCSSLTCAAVGLLGVEGSLTIADGSIAEAELGFRIEESDVDVTYGGSITNVESGQPVYIAGNNGGLIRFEGPVSSGDRGIGIYDNSSDTDVRFTGGIELNVSGGEYGDGFGLEASNGGKLTVTGASNTIEAFGVPGVAIVDTEIGSGGVTFESISSSETGVGIGLQNTGTVGRFKVTGDGGGGSGGFITSADIGIYALYDVDFEVHYMDLSGNGAPVGVLDGNGKAHVEDSEIELGSDGGAIYVGSSEGTLDAKFDANTFVGLSELEGAAAIGSEIYGDATVTLTMSNSTASDSDYGITVDVGESGALELVVEDNEFLGIPWPIYVYQSDDADVTYTISANELDASELSFGSGAIIFETGQEEAVPTGTQKGTITGNRIRGASGGTGIRIEAGGDMDAITTISNQTMNDGGLDTGILINAYDDAHLDANILSNDIDGSGEGGQGVVVYANDLGGVTNTCLRVETNTIDADSEAVFVLHDSEGTFKIHNLGGANPQTRIQNQNTITDGEVVVIRGETASNIVGGTCRTPPAL